MAADPVVKEASTGPRVDRAGSWRRPVSDLIFVVITVAFFAVATLVGRWCERAGQASVHAANGEHR